MKKVNIFAYLVGISALTATSVQSQTIKVSLFDDFKEGWTKRWVHRTISDKATQFEVDVEDDTNKVLKATSLEGASGLWRALQINTGRRGQVSWRWKVEETLSGNTKQRSKIGDDYAARVYVVFEPHMVSWKTQAICYVWAANGDIGSIYRSPYANSVGIVVLQSGSDNRNKWMSEKRDPIADYRKIFGNSPQVISAVALVVDTDNSKQEAVTRFDDLNIEIEEVKRTSQSGQSGR